MPEFVHRTVVGSAAAYLQNDIRTLEVVDTPQGPVILAAGGPNGALVSLTLGAGGQALIADAAAYTGSVASVLGGDLDLLDIGGQQIAVVGHASGQGLVGYEVLADGSLGTAVSVTVPGLQAGATGAVAVSATGFVYVASEAGAVGCYRPDAQGNLQGGAITYDSAATYLSSPVELVTARIGSQSYLLSLCDVEDGVSAYAIDAVSGHLDMSDSMGAQNGLGILEVPVAMEVAQIGGRTYVIVASSADQGEGGALSVMELTATGALRPVDHVLDTLDTRFGRVQDMSVIEFQGRSYVIVAGGDDGLSLFTMLPDGRLLHLDTIEDAAGLGLSSISAMTAVLDGDRIEILLASQDQAGLSQFTVSLGDQGVTLTAASGTLSGTGHDDLLAGGAGNNTISGGSGDDTLTDGQGTDRLVGGAGADVFLLEADGVTDLISDFQPGIDRIDLTLYPMLYSAAQIDIVPTSWGARLTIRGEITDVRRAGGGTLSESEVLAALDWDTGRVPMALPSEMRGTTGHDRMQGGTDDDLLRGYEGNDLLEGFDGNDEIIGGAGHDTLRGGNGADTLRGGDGNDRLQGQNSDDFIDGGAGNDTLLGGGQRDTLLGGEGNDRLEGRNGFDSLDGGSGADTLTGGANGDTLDGGDGADRLLGELGHDLLRGGAGADHLIGGADNDTLHGGIHADRLEGGANRDVLHGDDGDDYLNGQNGFDWLSGGRGNDTLIGEANADTLNGGEGNDRLDGGDGFDRLDGGAGHDHLLGGANADTLDGGTGADTLDGGVGHDLLRGGAGFDHLIGGADNDTLHGGSHADRLEGGANRDVLYGDDGHDYLNGQNGFDWLSGGTGDDTLIGEANADTLNGGEGNDLLDGGNGFDRLDGGAGADHLIGGANADTLNGGTGNDTLEAGIGRDVLTGGAGADTFVFRDGDEFNRITDFTPGSDALQLEVSEQGFADLTVTDTGQGARVQWTGGSVVLEGLSASDIDASDVIFV